MAGGLAALLDDVATLAKLAASSVDDVSAAASKAGMKAAGVVVDDAAVTPRYVHNFAAERELPMIRRIAVGSLRNKLLIIVPAALLLSEFLPWILTPLLMLGGIYLSYEGAEKIWEMVGGGHAKASTDDSSDVEPALPHGPEREKKMVAGAIRTDFILSSEIMVIALNEIADEGFVSRAIILVIVAIGITALIYGVVGLIVKIDDIGLYLTEQDSGLEKRLGHGLVKGMPHFMKVLATIGMAAMLWVGGHILLVGIDELGWHWPYDQVHHLEEEAAHVITGVAGFASWLTNTIASAIFGLLAGSVAVAVMHRLPGKANAH